MNKVDRYLLKQFYSALIFTVPALTGVFWLVQAVPLIDRIVLMGESIFTFFELSVLLIPQILRIVAPLAILTAAIFTANRMLVEAEMTVMGAVGLSHLQILKAFAVFGSVLTVLMYGLLLWLAPLATKELRSSLYTIERSFENNAIIAREFVEPVDDIYIFAERSLLSGEMADVFIYDRRNTAQLTNYFAERALLERIDGVSVLVLFDGESQTLNQDEDRMTGSAFTRLEVDLGELIATPNPRDPRIEEMTGPELLETGRASPRPGNYYSEYYERLTFPLLGLIMPVLAVAVLLRHGHSRHGYTRPIFLASVYGITLEASFLGLRSVVSNNPDFYWISAVPVIAGLLLILVYLLPARAKRAGVT